MRRWVIVVLALFGTLGISAAQTSEVVPVGTDVEIDAADGAVLRGTLYFPLEMPGESAPAVLLMHQNNGRRGDWLPLISALNAAGYAALAVDLRGFGETGGTRDFTKAQQDTQDWLFYLQNAQDIDAARTATIGASVGANLALVGCSVNEACLTAVALSPGLNFFNVEPEPELVSGGLSEKSALLIVSQRDSQSATGVKQMAASATGEVAMRVYSGGLHGTGLFMTQTDSLLPLIVNWLDEMLVAAPE